MLFGFADAVSACADTPDPDRVNPKDPVTLPAVKVDASNPLPVEAPFAVFLVGKITPTSLLVDPVVCIISYFEFNVDTSCHGFPAIITGLNLTTGSFSLNLKDLIIQKKEDILMKIIQPSFLIEV